jgi:pimeloyl-ACP methyl ester carboxylesterase
MIDRWIVFGGWALRPEILAPLFGPGAILIDTNEIMPCLVHDNSLVHDWQDIIAGRILPVVPEEPWGVAGWSTGSLLAYSLAQKTRPACGVFISATPSFCRRPGFPHGWKPSVLRAMRKELASDPEKVLTEMYSQCGIETSSLALPSPGERRENYKTADISHDESHKRLIAGLNFLEQTDILPVKLLPFPALFLHGKADAIIPHAAGKYFCDAAGGTFIEYDGPHAFFTNQHNDISEFINSYF